ncbi:3-beta hydroxysteroid dehydrogenase [Flavobacterium akiainvivens]|uniref:3-beta hydroxysteroid dehydrogenase n=1 Tax=Flavobacterium akiainvivens TaxID=1202724 RepID=A0A0M8MB42_9FLAO|nr:aldehyde reductase [Flavobacterium akiainvivens]KOS07413.1 3-beta hydroxysteroid dehydrogenase [Flavobacterium akiainvivens]SFQ47852.1 dihydroflavonol-4-reductase [Flavobacterium akiainvivens]
METDKTVLVTGGTGFIAVHIILNLLKQGYKVHTTVRNLNRAGELTEALKSAGITALDNLAFFEADLTKDTGWAEAVKGADYVLHVASPFIVSEPEDENELIVPAREGSLRVLKASRDAGVKRVVLTSSFAAIGYSNNTPGHVFTEADWTHPTAPIGAYIKSKTIAEMAAWDFIATEGNGLELSVINPVGVFGPAVGGITSASVDWVIKDILEGKVAQTFDFAFGAVDVRDVADIHITAMTHPGAAGQRFLATAEGAIAFYDVAKLIQKERPQYADKVQTFDKPDDSKYPILSNQKAVTVLGWQPRSKEEAVLASVDSLRG